MGRNRTQLGPRGEVMDKEPTTINFNDLKAENFEQSMNPWHKSRKFDYFLSGVLFGFMCGLLLSILMKGAK